MASTTAPSPNRRVRAASRKAGRSRLQRTDAASRHQDRSRADGKDRNALAHYTDFGGRTRELITEAGTAGSLLVVDRHAVTLGDRRLVAHLAPDEPPGNAQIVSRSYLERARSSRLKCRPLTAEDLITVPFGEDDRELPLDGLTDVSVSSGLTSVQVDRAGRRYRLERLSTGMSIPELRWCRRGSATARAHEPVSLREAVGALQAYEPICAQTESVVRLGRFDDSISTAMLRAELARVRESPIVLNRGLREAVLAASEHGALSLSEIAMRCGRVKRDTAGNVSGETSWLARRLGMMPEGGRAEPTPWVHSDVLALIARDGLGVGPREVELN